MTTHLTTYLQNIKAEYQSRTKNTSVRNTVIQFQHKGTNM